MTATPLGFRDDALADADVYAKLGFTALPKPGHHMHKHDPDVYLRAGEAAPAP